MRKSLWSPDEDEKLKQYVAAHGCGNWSDVAKHTGLLRCGKSCRLRWINYLRPDLKRGPFTAHEVRIVVHLHKNLGNSWSKIATHLPGRTDNDVKNFWHSYTRSRRLQRQQQQQQQANNIALHNSSVHNNDHERHYSYNGIYNHHSNANVVDKKLKTEEKEYGNANHIDPQLPPLVFPSCNTNIHKEVGDCKIPSIIKVDSPHAFQFTDNGKHDQHLPSPSSSTGKLLTGSHHHSINHPSHYSVHLHSNMPPIQEDVKSCGMVPLTTTTKPVMIHNLHLDSDAQGALAMMYKRVQSQITKSCKGPHAATSLDHPTPPLQASLNSAVSSTSADIHSQVKSAAADDWSLMVSPSMQLTCLLSSHASAHDAAAVGFDQATFIDENGRPAPESLQSVIWRFFNQQEASTSAGPAAPADHHQQAHSHHFFHNQHRHQMKPTSYMATSIPPSTADINIHPPIELAAADLDVEAFSTSAALQYLQSQLAADCF